LEGKANVDEGGDSLDTIVVLGVVEEESLAALVCWMPFENVELRRPGSVAGSRFARRVAPASGKRASSGVEGWIASREVRSEAVQVGHCGSM